jgi:hypothetical protein
MRDNMYVYIHHHIILFLYKIINIYTVLPLFILIKN